MSRHLDRFPNAFGEPKEPLYDKAIAALRDLAKKNPRAAESCCMTVMGPVWQTAYAKNLGAKPVGTTYIEELLKSASKRGFAVPKIPVYHDYPSPPRNDHGTLWMKGRTPVCYTSEPYFSLTEDFRQEIKLYCDRWGLRWTVEPRSLWYPTKTLMIKYEPIEDYWSPNFSKAKNATEC